MEEAKEAEEEELLLQTGAQYSEADNIAGIEWRARSRNVLAKAPQVVPWQRGDG